MENALAWIGQIADWIGRFVPRWVILDTTQGAVKFVRGKRPVALGPGIHWYWPATTELREWAIARQSLNLPAQTITTRDSKVIAVGGLLIFKVSDVLTLLAKNWDADRSIRDVAAGVVHEVCSQSEWGELQMAKNDGSLNRELRRVMRKRLRPFGVQVLGATLTDFAPCRVLKVIQSTSQDAA